MPGVIPYYPPSLRACHGPCFATQARTAPSAPLPPSGVSRCLTSFTPRCSRVAFLRFTQKPQHRNNGPFPLRYANCAGRSTQPTGRALHASGIPGHLPGLRFSILHNLLAPCPGVLRPPPSGKIASGPRIRAKSFVTLRTEPGFCGPRQSCSPLHGQNCSSRRSSQDCPFCPFYSCVATQPNTEDPSGKRLLLRPIPLTQ